MKCKFFKGTFDKTVFILMLLYKLQTCSTLIFTVEIPRWKRSQYFLRIFTAWKVSKDGVFFGPYFPVFVLNTEISYSVQIQENTDQKKPRIWTRFTQWLTGKKTPSNKIPALTESMNKDICVVSTLNQLFIRGS